VGQRLRHSAPCLSPPGALAVPFRLQPSLLCIAAPPCAQSSAPCARSRHSVFVARRRCCSSPPAGGQVRRRRECAARLSRGAAVACAFAASTCCASSRSPAHAAASPIAGVSAAYAGVSAAASLRRALQLPHAPRPPALLRADPRLLLQRRRELLAQLQPPSPLYGRPLPRAKLPAAAPLAECQSRERCRFSRHARQHQVCCGAGSRRHRGVRGLCSGGAAAGSPP